MIVGEIEENDDKVRSVYGGSVEQTACLNLARSCAPEPRRVPKPGRAPVTARRGAARRRGRDRDGKDGLDDGRDHLCMWTNDRPGASFCQLLETNREKRLSPIRLRGISFENREKGQDQRAGRSSRAFATHVQVTTTLPRKRNGRALHLANFRKIEENDKVPSVYGGSDPSTEDQLGKRKCLSTFFSSEFRTDRQVNGGSNKEPLTR